MSDRRTDRGFTLIEVILVTVLIGVVVAVVAASLVIILRTTPGAQVRADDSRTYQGLVTWLPRDVASTPDDGSGIVTYPGSLTCAGAESAAGTNLLELTWTQDEGAGDVTYVAAYRFETTSATSAVVRRHRCSSDAAYANLRTLNLTSPLDASSVPTVTAPASPGGHYTVAMEFITTDEEVFVVGGEDVVVEAVTRNPAATLPTTTVPPGPPVIIPCDASFPSPPAPYGPVGRKTNPPDPVSQVDKLAAAVSVDIEVTGDTCGVVELRYDTGTTVITQSVTPTGTPGTYTIVIPEGTGGPGTPTWTAGIKTLEVLDDGVPLSGTTTLEVT